MSRLPSKYVPLLDSLGRDNTCNDESRIESLKRFVLMILRPRGSAAERKDEKSVGREPRKCVCGGGG